VTSYKVPEPNLYKNPPAASRKYSGSQTRIPIFRGTSQEKDGSHSSRNRSSSLSNYNGAIPRVKSNEKLEPIENITRVK
jgi:hypothetical protein